MVTPDAGSCDVITDGVPLDRGPDHCVAALLVTRDLTEYGDLEHQIQQEAAEHVRERAELEAQIQAAEERAANAVADGDVGHGRERLATEEEVRASTELEARVGAGEQSGSASGRHWNALVSSFLN